jgi:hypothetical protein
MRLECFEKKIGFNKPKNDEYTLLNQEIVSRHKQDYLNSQKYNTKKLIVSSREYQFSADEIIFRDINCTLI